MRRRESRFSSPLLGTEEVYDDGHSHRWHDHSPRRQASRSPRRKERDRFETDNRSSMSRPKDSGWNRSEESRAQRERMRSREPSPIRPPISSRSPLRLLNRGPVHLTEFRRDSFKNSTALLISNRKDPSSTCIPPPFASSHGVVRVGAGSGSGSTLDSFGSLVSRSLVMGDGTVRTYFTLNEPGLETDIGLPPPTDGTNAGYPEAVAAYGRGTRHAPAREGNDQWESGRFGIIGQNVGGFMHDKPVGERLFPERGGCFTSVPPSELQSGNAGFDLPSHRYRQPSPFRDPPPKRLASPRPFADNTMRRDSPQRQRPAGAFGLDSAERGFTDLPGHFSRDRPVTPSILGPKRREFHYQDPMMNAYGDGRTVYKESPPPEAPRRVPFDNYHRDSSAMYTREVPPNSFSRDGPVGAQRESRLAPCMEDPMDGVISGKILRTAKSPRREEPRSEVYASKRGPLYKPGMEGYMSPRKSYQNQGMPASPEMRGGPPLEGLDMYESGRGASKRKYMELPKEFLENGRRIFSNETVVKRGSPYRDIPSERFGRRYSPERSHGFRGREDSDYTCGRDFERRPRGERGDLPLRLGRGSHYSDDDIRELNHDGHYRDRSYDGDHLHERPYRTSKFSGPSTERERSWRAHERGNFPDIQEQVLTTDLPEDSKDFKQQVHRAYLRFSKVLNEKTGQTKRFEEQGKAGTLLCLVCSRFSKPFVDTHSLVMHAYNSKKRGLRAEHLGFHKAVCTLMGWSSVKEPDNGKVYHHISPEEAQANKEDLIMWPPAVIIHNARVDMRSNDQQDGIGNPEVDELLKEVGQANGKVRVIYGRQGHLGTLLVKYLATFSGLQDAEKLHRHFETYGHGRKNWIVINLNTQQEGPDLVCVDEKTKERRVLYGYLALAEDLDKVDAETRRRCLVRSRKEIDAIAVDPLTGNHT